MVLPTSPVLSSTGAMKLNTPISTAMPPSSLRRPRWSDSQPDTMMAPAARNAPTICTPRIWVTGCSEYRVIHDSGNTVTRWNSAKLASAAKAPSSTLLPSSRMTRLTGTGCSSRSLSSSEYDCPTTRRRRANRATTFTAKATKNG